DLHVLECTHEEGVRFAAAQGPSQECLASAVGQELCLPPARPAVALGRRRDDGDKGVLQDRSLERRHQTGKIGVGRSEPQAGVYCGWHGAVASSPFCGAKPARARSSSVNCSSTASLASWAAAARNSVLYCSI